MKKNIFSLLMVLCAGNCVAADLENGYEINETCAGCHGEFAQGGNAGEYPRLAGLPEKYIIEQLKLFQVHGRKNIPMDPYTKKRELSDTDAIDVAAFLSRTQLINKLPPIDDANFDAYERLEMTRKLVNIARIDGDYEQGRKIYQIECVNCHGKNGLGKKNVPMLAGQYTTYLKRQIDKFVNGERFHDNEPVSESIFKDFSSAEIDNMLAYLTILDD